MLKVLKILVLALIILTVSFAADQIKIAKSPLNVKTTPFKKSESFNPISHALAAPSLPKIEAKIYEELNLKEMVRVVVILKEDLIATAQKLNEEEFKLKKEKIKEKQNKVLLALPKIDFKLKNKYKTISAFSGLATKDGIKKLENHPDVKMVYLDKKAYASLSESVPLINADDVWTSGYTGNGETVCVIDTGVDYTHPDLGGCFGSGCKVVGGYDFVNSDNDPIDDNGHGTHCAGIVASENSTYKGVAPGAKIAALKTLDSLGSGWFSDTAAAIDWCIFHKDTYDISVISMSLGDGGEYDESEIASECDPYATAVAINTAFTQGIFVSVASGNEGYKNGISYPACASKAISVGGVYDADVGPRTWCVKRNITGQCTKTCTDDPTASDKIICFTNRDEILDLLAPGCITTSSNLGGGTVGYCGTSMAAPHVAGAAALLLEADPSLIPFQLRDILKNTGVSISDSETGLTFPRIDAKAALDSLSPVVSISITSDGLVEFGTVALEETVNSSDDIQTISVDSGPAKLSVRTTLFSDGTDNWTLGASGDNQVVWEYSKNGTDWDEFLTADDLHLLESSVPQSETRNLHLQLTMPTDSDSFEEYSSTVTIVATSP